MSLRATDHGVNPKECTNGGRALLTRQEMDLKELIRLSRLTPRWWKCRPRTSSRRKAIKTKVTEEVGVPCVKVDTPDLQPGDEVEVIITALNR